MKEVLHCFKSLSYSTTYKLFSIGSIPHWIWNQIWMTRCVTSKQGHNSREQPLFWLEVISHITEVIKRGMHQFNWSKWMIILQSEDFAGHCVRWNFGSYQIRISLIEVHGWSMFLDLGMDVFITCIFSTMASEMLWCRWKTFKWQTPTCTEILE